MFKQKVVCKKNTCRKDRCFSEIKKLISYYFLDDFLLAQDFEEQDLDEEVFFVEELQEQVELQLEPYN